MSQSLDLKQIEKKAFRATHQDGLWDIYMGGIVLSMSFLAYSDAGEAFPLLRFGLYLAGMGVFYLIFWGGRKFITTPRLGQVKFGLQRQKRKRSMIFILAGIVLVQALVLVGTVFLWMNPQSATDLGFSHSDQERLLVAMIGALFVGPSMLLIAYFNEFLRGYYISLILSLAVFSLIWFGRPIYLTAASLLIMLPGVIVFLRFLRKHPLPPAEIKHA